MAERVSYLRTAAVMFTEKPLAGHGWGEFFYRHMQLKDTDSNESAHDPHNVVASFAVHTGVLGGILAFAAFVFPLWMLWKRRRTLDLLTNLCLWGCVGSFIHALQDINLQSPAPICALMLLLAVNQSNSSDAADVPGKLKYALLIFFVMLGAVSCIGNWQYTQGDIAMSKLEECCRPPTKEKLHLSTPYNVEKRFREVNALRPAHPFAFSLAGAFFLAGYDVEKAEFYYSRALKLDPRRPGVLRKLADICELKGDAKQSEKLRERARELFPSNPEYRTK